MHTPRPADDTILAAALERPAGPERAAYLDSACAGDSALRARLDALLRAHDEASHLLATSAFVSPPPVTAVPTEKPGDQIGRYKLLQPIGEGGCGIVYLAEQQEPVVRRVALKVIKLGMDTREVVARFEAERQALALMNHPNIASVLDGGATERGRPFFVMELVRGVPITKYCDEQNLSTAARLELFTAVCHAVQHAHQKGIIHRDLKPSNILVTLHDGKPVPKVIDFGIAKATQGKLTDATLFTAFEQFIGTPAYMSPEQAELSGLDIDTRSDIYSLGVLLYELLTGRPPFDPKTLLNAGLDEIRRIIREVDPPRPSTRLSTLTDADRSTVARMRGIAPARLSTLLRGDLDWIVMRSLEKDRTRRYETASALALDLHRHLGDETVTARPPSPRYRLGKFVRRNKIMVSGAAAIAFVLLSGIVATTWQAIRARRAEAIAVEERNRARSESVVSKAISDFLQKDLLQNASPAREPDRDIKLRTVLDRAAASVRDRFHQQPLVEAALTMTLAETYHSLGEWSTAEKLGDRAIELTRQALGPEHSTTLDRMNAVALWFAVHGKSAEAEKRHRETAELRRKSLGAEHDDTLESRIRLADTLRRQRKWDEAEKLDSATLEILRQKVDPQDPSIARMLSRLAGEQSRRGHHTEAVKLYEQAVAFQKLAGRGEEHNLALFMRGLAKAYSDLGRYADATGLLEQALAVQRVEFNGEQHPDLLWTMSDLARVHFTHDNIEAAETIGRAILERRQRVLGGDHSDTLYSLEFLCTVCQRQRKFTEAAKLREEIAATYRRVRGPTSEEYIHELWTLALALETAGDYVRAEEAMRSNFELQARRSGHTVLGRILNKLGRFDEAANLIRPQYEERLKLSPDANNTHFSRSALGCALVGIRQFSEAEGLLLAAHAGLTANYQGLSPQDQARLPETIAGLIALYRETAQPDKAADWQKRLDEWRLTQAPERTATTRKP